MLCYVMRCDLFLFLCILVRNKVPKLRTYLIFSCIYILLSNSSPGTIPEFYGMCTHMTEASANCKYTNDQMPRFKSLFKRVREAYKSVLTISTDNSSALFTSNLNHFNPDELSSQPNVTNTLGFVRTGRGIFGSKASIYTIAPSADIDSISQCDMLSLCKRD